MISLPVPETIFFHDSPPLPITAAHNTIDIWENGGTCQSTVVPIGHIALAEQHAAVLNAMSMRTTRPYASLWMSYINKEKLTDQERALCLTLRDSFAQIVDRDGKRSGYTEHFPIDILAGWYSARRNKERKHVDSSPRSDHIPHVRWVASFGLGSTIFLEGDMSRDMFTKTGELNHRRITHMRPVVHPPGTVLRFMCNIDVHEGPNENGPRIFLSTDKQLSRR